MGSILKVLKIPIYKYFSMEDAIKAAATMDGFELDV